MNAKQRPEKLPGGITGKGFRPGQSGNPAGRPGYKRLTEALEREVAKRATKGSGTREDQLASTLVQLAMGGDIHALRLVFERLEGRPAQAITVDGGLELTQGGPKARAQQLIESALQRQR